MLLEYALGTYLQCRPDLMRTVDSDTSECSFRSSHHTHSTDTCTSFLQPAQHAPPAISAFATHHAPTEYALAAYLQYRPDPADNAQCVVANLSPSARDAAASDDVV